MRQMSFIHWCQISGSKSSWWCNIIPSTTSWSTSLSSSSNWFFNSSTTDKILAVQVYVQVKSPVKPGHWFGYVAALQKTKPSKLWIVPLGEEEIGWTCEYEIQITKYETLKIVNCASWRGGDWMGMWIRNTNYEIRNSLKIVNCASWRGGDGMVLWISATIWMSLRSWAMSKVTPETGLLL